MAEVNEVALNDKNVINIVLFGEAGVGKSTFVNAVANYMTYSSLEDASRKKALYPIPVKFKLMNDDFEEQIVQIGESDNEAPGEGVSSTQNPKTYLLKIPEKNINLRIIDTPGIGDTRGLAYDEKNTEKILALLGELDHVNAFCILMKPNNSRITVLFEHCIKHLLSKLDKKVFQNFVFVFTNARSSFFTPGDTYIPLKAMLDKISTDSNKIPFDKNNTFCIDNESVRYLAAKTQGFEFSEQDVKEYSDSWRKSKETITRLIDYVKNLTPISMMGSLSVNEARRIIFKLATPIIQVMEKLEESKETLLQHERTLLENQNSLSRLKSLLTIPVIRYDIKETTVTTETPNRRPYFKPKLSWTPPFVSFSFGIEMTVTQKTVTTTSYTPRVSYEEAANIKPIVEEKEALKAALNDVIKQLKLNVDEYESEGKVLIDAIVHFTVFLRENAFVYGNDFFKNDLIQLIYKERKIGNSRRLETYEDLFATYLEKIDEVSGVTPEKIAEIKNTLLNQKHFGAYLKFFYEISVEAHDTALSL